MASIVELWKVGDLTACVTAALAAVREEPADRAARHGLAELLLFAGDLERADKHLDFLANAADPNDMMRVLMLRRLIRAETTRREVFAQGRAPQLLAAPPANFKPTLEALVCLREGQSAAAAKLLEEAEELRAKPVGTCDGEPFDDFRDLDDVTAGVLEVLTAHGEYFWLPLEAVRVLEFARPEVRADLLWRRARLQVNDGPEGDVFVPTTYPGAHAEADAFRLGRQTDYRGGDGSTVRGVGLREFLVGDAAKAIMELTRLECGGARR